MPHDESRLLEVLASRELQERSIANATKDEYELPENLWNHAADFVDHVERYEKALATHPDLATMSVPEMHRRTRDQIPPFTRSPGPLRDPLLSIADVLVARKVPATALAAVEKLRHALKTHADSIKESSSWAALVRESPGWESIRQAAEEYLTAVKDAPTRPAD